MELVDYKFDENNRPVQMLKECKIDIIGSTSVGFNAPKIVNLSGEGFTLKGFYKNSQGMTTTFDKFEYLVSKLGKYLNVKNANEFLVKNDDAFSLFSESVVKDNEELIMASNIPKEILKNGRMTNDELESEKTQIDDFNKTVSPILPGKTDAFKVGDDNIEYVVNMFINNIKQLQLPNEEEIIHDYINMCFFDSLIGNKDRNDNNYGIIKREDGSYSFAPLFDSSTIAIPDICDDLCRIGNYYINRYSFCKYLLNTYPQYIENLFTYDINQIGEMMTSLSKKILNDNEFEWFQAAVLSRINSRTFDIIQNQRF